MKRTLWHAILLALAATASAQTKAGQLTISVDKPGVQVSPLLYGIFFEEINRAGEGGIYAEMIQNRSFEDAATPVAWKAVNATLSPDKSVPLNADNPTSLKVEAAAGGGAANGGFARDWHLRNDPGRISVEEGKKYDLSLYARATNPVTLTVALEGANRKVLASQKITGLGPAWKPFSATLAPSESDAYARVVVSSDAPATFWLDMVSLFPQHTWKGRKNGLRADLMERLAAMKPAFVRFPGGCFVEGRGIENRVQWKKTIGPVAERPGHLNANWGYYSSDGLGYHEYLQMCEDLGAEPLFVINCGIGHDDKGMYVVPMDQMGPYVQDALDAIEYANGPVTSTWGALRAQNGHPEPFNLKMMEIGNENWGSDYDARYALFHDAIKAAYPAMQLIANERTASRTNDIIDPHMYSNPSAFRNAVNAFDSYSRSGPKVYVGEYAVTEGGGAGNLRGALAEAAYMTGLERNSDVVVMGSYAPLFCRTNWKAWNPDAIYFDQSRSCGTPSYWVQAMFGANRGDQLLPVSLEVAAATVPDISGKIGVGTWGGSAEFKDIKVTGRDGQVLYQSDFTQGMTEWQALSGDWSIDATNSALMQTNTGINGTLAKVGDAAWSNYTLTLRARKISGSEGFQITFGSAYDGEASRWNIGGWGNTAHGVESPGFTAPLVSGTIDTDRWYDVKIELQGARANFYLDGQLVQSATRQGVNEFTAVAGRDNTTGDTILKFVNASGESRTVDIALQGAQAGTIYGHAWVLTSTNELGENSFGAPASIAPEESAFDAGTASFTRTFPAKSVTVLRWSSTASPVVVPAPGGLATTAYSTAAALSWTASAGATSYNIKRATTSGGPYTLVASVGTTSFTDPILTGGATYYYVISAADAYGESTNSAEVSVSTLGNTVSSTTSVAAQDGYVRASSSANTMGGSVTGTSGRVGDDSSNRQYKTILSFETSAIPAAAAVVSAAVKIKRSGLTGTSPFTTHGTCYADIKRGGFSGNTALETADFQAAADAAQVAAMSAPATNGTWSTGSLNAMGRGQINKGGTTQFRIAFALAQNADAGNEYISWYTGDDASSTNRPVLEVTYATMPPSAAATAWLKFDETNGTSAADSTGNGWAGTLVNGPTWAAGTNGNAVTLDGVDDHVTLPSGVVAGLTNFTVSAWVKLNATNAWSRIFDFGTGTTNYAFLTANGNGLRYGIRTPATAEQVIDSGAALATNAWTHVAVTVSGSVGTLYVNGVATGTNAAMTLNPASLGVTTQNYIGKSQYADPYFNGKVDDFRILNSALSAPNIAALVSPPAVPAGLTATPGNAKVALAWTPASGALSYNVKRATASGGPYATILTGFSGSSYTDFNVTNGAAYYYVVTAVNGVVESGNTSQASATPQLPSPPVITSAATASGATGAEFRYQIAAGNSPTSYGATGLPDGLSVNAGTGLISGTPTAGGTFTATITASNAGGTGSAVLTITVLAPAPVIAGALSASGTIGAEFSYQIIAGGTPTSYGATGLPDGLTVDAATGLISGTPATGGTFAATISASNVGGTGSATLTISIFAPVTVSTPAQVFPLSSVRLLDGPFTGAVSANRTYLLALEPDRLLAPFRREAGLTPRAAAYPDWESAGLDGHTAGHYLAALANMIASGDDTADHQLASRLDYMLGEMELCQQANGDGYIGGVPGSRAFWATISSGDVAAVWTKWVP